MRTTVLFIVFSLLHASANAAPLWLERRFIPDAELIDERFSQYSGESTETVDHTRYTDFLSAYVVEGYDGVNRVAYRTVSPADRAALEAYIAQLEQIDITRLARKEQLAFWINLYNAATLRIILEHYPVASIRDIDEPWRQSVVAVNGVELTLNDIEHGVIRPIFNDPRIHYAVNCASIGCGGLARRAYSGDEVDAMLDTAARTYVNHPRGVRVDHEGIVVSKIYGWYREDFGDSEAAILDHVRRYADPGLRARLSGATDIDDYEYDWSLNDLGFAD